MPFHSHLCSSHVAALSLSLSLSSQLSLRKDGKVGKHRTEEQVYNGDQIAVGR